MFERILKVENYDSDWHKIAEMNKGLAKFAVTKQGVNFDILKICYN